MSPEFKTLLLKLIFFLDSEKISVTFESGKVKITNLRNGEFKFADATDPETLYQIIDYERKRTFEGACV